MTSAARKFEREVPMPERAVLDEKIEHLQKGVTEVKADVRRLDEKIGHLQKDVTEVKADVRRLDAKIDSVSNSLSAQLSEHRLETERAFGKLRMEMKEALERLGNNRVSHIFWMIGTMITATGVALTAVKVFAGP